jgi:hypothetical protein
MQRRKQVNEIATAARRGDAAKVIIITVCVFAMILMLLCVGGGVAGYFWIKSNFGRVALTAPADVQKLTTEITDITIPPQFTPLTGSAIFGMKTVMYAWNPTNKPLTLQNWGQSQDDMHSQLNLMEMGNTESVAANDFKIAHYEKDALKQQYGEFTDTVREFDIRGHKCEFLFVTGRPKEGAFEDEMIFDEADEAVMAEEDKATTDKPAETPKTDEPAATESPMPTDANATPPAETTSTETKPAEEPKADKPAEKLLPAVHSVTGKFPGKSGPTTITIRIPAEGADEDLLLKIIQSIH